jgi:tetratricopeptide (TPR) repeat protein
MIRPRLSILAGLITIGLALASAGWAAQQTPARPRSISELQAAVAKSPGDPDLHVALGLAYWSRNDYPRALEAFRRAVDVGPRSADAHNWLGVALMEKADLTGAIAALRKAVALDAGYGRAWTNLGAALVRSGDYREAVTVFKRALTLEPNSPAAQMNLGMALRETGDLDEALAHLTRAAEGGTDNAGVHYELGQTRQQRGDLAEAVAAFERALAIDPELREGYYALGTALKQQRAALRRGTPPALSPADDLYQKARDLAAKRDLGAARDLLTQALRLDERHAEARNLLGFILGQQGNLPEAVAELERAVGLRPDLADAHYNLGVALWYRGDRDRGIAELRESTRLDPAAGASYAFLGAALRDAKDAAGARVSLQRAIALLPPTAAVYIDLAIVYARAGDVGHALGQFEAGLNLPASGTPAPDWAEAAASLRAALAAGSPSADAHHVLGRLLGRLGAAGADVTAQFREAIRIRPDFAAAHNHLGLVLLQEGDDAGAIAALREAVRLDPDYADAHANLGAALTPTDAAAAIGELERAIALAPTAISAQFNLALAYGASTSHGGDREIAQLRKVIALAPEFARAHLALGKALLREARVPEAVTALQDAARLDPESGEAHYQLGLALSRAGRKEEAAASLAKGRSLVAAADRREIARLDAAKERAAPERPRDDAARVAELEGFIRESRFADVEPLLAQYVKDRPASTWGWYAYGYSLFAQEKVGESIRALSKSLELDLHNAEAHKMLGRALMVIGRFDAAQVEFEQALRDKPDSAELHYNLGKLFSMQDNWEPARASLETAVKLDPSYVEALDALGFAREALGDDTGAVAMYEAAIRANAAARGGFALAHVNLSAFYNRNGDSARALEYAQQALAIDPKSDRAFFQKARADEREGRLDAAAQALRSAISFNQRASSYYYVLAGVYRRLGQTEESREALAVFTKLERESQALDKMRRTGDAAPPAPPPGVRRE